MNKKIGITFLALFTFVLFVGAVHVVLRTDGDLYLNWDQDDADSSVYMGDADGRTDNAITINQDGGGANAERMEFILGGTALAYLEEDSQNFSVSSTLLADGININSSNGLWTSDGAITVIGVSSTDEIDSALTLSSDVGGAKGVDSNLTITAGASDTFYGVYSRSESDIVIDNANTYYGGYFEADNSGSTLFNDATLYGIYGNALGMSSSDGSVGYGVYGTATGSDTNYAGYFNGDVLVDGNIYSADGDNVFIRAQGTGYVNLFANAQASARFDNSWIRLVRDTMIGADSNAASPLEVQGSNDPLVTLDQDTSDAAFIDFEGNTGAQGAITTVAQGNYTFQALGIKVDVPGGNPDTYIQTYSISAPACPRVDGLDSGGEWKELGRAIRYSDGKDKAGRWDIDLEQRERDMRRFRIVEDEAEVSYIWRIRLYYEYDSPDGMLLTRWKDVDLGADMLVTTPGSRENPGTTFEFSAPVDGRVVRVSTWGYYDWLGPRDEDGKPTFSE